MQTSARGRNFIKDREQRRLKAYWDVDGWAIGYGDHRDVHEGTTITAEEAERRFNERVREVETAVLALLSRKPTQSQLDAMVSLAYNIGLGWYGARKKPGERDGFRQSTVLRQFNAGNDTAAANAFGLWTKITKDGKKVDHPELVRRRALEKALFLEDVAGTVESEESAAPKPAPPVDLAATGTVQGAKAATVVTLLAIAKSLVDQFQDLLMNVPWVGELFQVVVAYSPKIAIVLGVATLVAVGYVVWRRTDDRAQGRV